MNVFHNSAARSPAAHKTIVLVDVYRFSHPRRTHQDHLVIREGLYRALSHAFHYAGIPWNECYREDRGDGVLILVPANIPKEFVASRLPGTLASEISRYNTRNPVSSCIRLRLALHAGEITRDTHGVSSPALIHAFRLLDAPEFKTQLAGNTAAVGVITSTWFFEHVISQLHSESTTDYTRVRVRLKGTPMTGWVTFVRPLFSATPTDGNNVLRVHFQHFDHAAPSHWRPRRGRHRQRPQRVARSALISFLMRTLRALSPISPGPRQVHAKAATAPDAVTRPLRLVTSRSAPTADRLAWTTGTGGQAKLRRELAWGSAVSVTAAEGTSGLSGAFTG